MKRARRLVETPVSPPPVSVPQPAQQQFDAKKWRESTAEAAAMFRDGRWADARSRWVELAERYGETRATASTARLYKSVCDRLVDFDHYRRALGKYQDAIQPGLKVCVYSAIAGGYDSLKVPHLVNTEFEYVVFTDGETSNLGIYDVRPMPFHDADPTRAARFVKTHPHHLLPGCDIAIWIDSNIMMVDKIDSIIRDFLASGMAVATIPHPQRFTVAEEVEACTSLKKDDPEVMRRQLESYARAGFETNDLVESNFMIFDLRQPACCSFLDIWWREISRHSRRDQLSLNFALFEAGAKSISLTNRPHSVRDHPCFAMVPHDKGEGPANLLATRLAETALPKGVSTTFAAARDCLLEPISELQIDIVVCVHNALEDVQECFASIERKRAASHRLIIIDDGSGTSTKDFLERFASARAWVELVRHETAFGYTKAANAGLARSTAPFVILLNSDTIVTDRWAEKMAHAVFSASGAGLVGPMSNAASHQSLPEHIGGRDQTAINELPPGKSADDMNSLCEQWTPADFVPRVPLVHGFCFGITRETIQKIGLFDDGLFPRGYGEENDYCFRASDAGISLVIATHTFVFHAKSKSYDSAARIELMKAGSEAFRARHGTERVKRSVAAMQTNPHFVRMRELARELF